MIYLLMATAALLLIAFGYWLGDTRKSGAVALQSIGLHAASEALDRVKAERDDLTEQNRRLRNQITAMNLALGLSGQELNYVPKKVVAAHYAVKAAKR